MFRGEFSYFDIAIIVLDKKNIIHFTSTIGPICLPFMDSSYESRAATLAGWGVINDPKNSSATKSANTLQRVPMTIGTEATCKKLEKVSILSKLDYKFSR